MSDGLLQLCLHDVCLHDACLHDACLLTDTVSVQEADL